MLIPILVASFLTAAEPNEAEKLFRDMEKKVTSAKAAEIETDIFIERDRKVEISKQLMLFAEGNKCHVEGTSKSGGKSRKSVLISDGKNMQDFWDGRELSMEKTLDDLTLTYKLMIARTGVLVMNRNLKSGFKVEEFFTATDFKLGDKEKVQVVDTQKIQYTFLMKEEKEPLTVSLWLDSKTNLPVKRIVTRKDDDTKITEYYLKFTLDPKFDPKMFELPKE
jgi:hypothetical protein